ncbi:MAG: hypothetical protein IKH77_08535 [Clostridia bacterium]|nr:hypothetical protein [Clostridia bacterium]
MRSAFGLVGVLMMVLVFLIIPSHNGEAGTLDTETTEYSIFNGRVTIPIPNNYHVLTRDPEVLEAFTNNTGYTMESATNQLDSHNTELYAEDRDGISMITVSQLDLSEMEVTNYSTMSDAAILAFGRIFQYALQGAGTETDHYEIYSNSNGKYIVFYSVDTRINHKRYIFQTVINSTSYLFLFSVENSQDQILYEFFFKHVLDGVRYNIQVNNKVECVIPEAGMSISIPQSFSITQKKNDGDVISNNEKVYLSASGPHKLVLDVTVVDIGSPTFNLHDFSNEEINEEADSFLSPSDNESFGVQDKAILESGGVKYIVYARSPKATLKTHIYSFITVVNGKMVSLHFYSYADSRESKQLIQEIMNSVVFAK